MGSSHSLTSQVPGVGWDQNVRLTDFAIFNFVAAGGIRVSQTQVPSFSALVVTMFVSGILFYLWHIKDPYPSMT